MPPAIDAHVRPVPTGDEWAWVGSPPDQGIGLGASLEWEAGTLTAVDRDETFGLVPWAASAAAVATLRKGWWGAEIAVPVMWVPDRELGLSGTRISLLGAWDAGVLARASMLDPGDLGWGSAWTSTRFEGSLSWSSHASGAELAASWGEDGWGTRAAAGTSLPLGVDLEFAWSRVWAEVPAGTLEAGIGRDFTLGGTFLRPFVAVGIGDTPGTPSLRVALDVRRSERVPAPPAPVLPPPPPDPQPATPPPPPEPAQDETQTPPVDPVREADKTPIPPSEVQPALDSAAQAAAVGGVAAFLAKHPEVLLMEVRVTGPCLPDGSPDPIGETAARDLSERLTVVGVTQDRVRIVVRQCVAGGKGTRIEAVVIRAQK